MRDPKERLRDILEAISNTEKYLVRGKESFERDELLQSWFRRQLKILGEAGLSEQPIHALVELVAGRTTLIGRRHPLLHFPRTFPSPNSHHTTSWIGSG